jgi:hypothetical protein
VSKIFVDQFPFDPAAQEIGPQKLAKWRRVFGKPTDPAQFAGETSERIVDEIANRVGNVFVLASPTVLIKGMQPTAIVEKDPKRFFVDLAQIGHDGNEHVLPALLMERKGEVMVIDNVVVLLGPQDYGYHVGLEKLQFLFRTFRSPEFPFGFNLAHADGYLRGSQLVDVHWLECRLPNYDHIRLLYAPGTSGHPPHRKASSLPSHVITLPHPIIASSEQITARHPSRSPASRLMEATQPTSNRQHHSLLAGALTLSFLPLPTTIPPPAEASLGF